LILMIALASGFNIYAQMDDLNVQTSAVQTVTPVKSTGKVLQSSQTKKVESTHYKGGVASAAFDAFESMSADDFKMANKKSTKTVKATSERGRTVKTTKVPSLPAPGVKVHNIAVKTPVVSMTKKNNLSAPKTASISLILDNFKKTETPVTKEKLMSGNSE
jgi:hypothetical protein